MIKISNQFQYPINCLFEDLFDADFTEQRYMQHIREMLRNKSELVCGQICSVITPITDCMSLSFPVFRDEELGGKIRILREDASLSRKLFAETCGITLVTLKQIESNQHLPSAAVFCAICKALKISPEYLLAKKLTCLSQDGKFYVLTLRQLKALDEAVSQLCRYLK